MPWREGWPGPSRIAAIAVVVGAVALIVPPAFREATEFVDSVPELFAGAFELIPIIGPLLGAIPGVLVALATSPGDLLWVVLLYTGVQLVENVVLVPRIQGRAVDIHPAIIMLLLVISSEVAGLRGVIVAVPLAAVARDVFLYFLHEWSEDPAGPPDDTPPPDESSVDVSGGTAPPPTA
ncbi:MAG: AI-2E family transporter [SAR202 cluster bacterium]|nr:AI-2E family transporter [SAR202 cluster bacterium]